MLFCRCNEAVALAAVVEVALARKAIHYPMAHKGGKAQRDIIEKMGHATGILLQDIAAVERATVHAGQTVEIIRTDRMKRL